MSGQNVTMARVPWPDAEIATLLEAHGAGTPRREIARLLGRPKATIDYRLAALGVRVAPRGSTLEERFWQNVDRGDETGCWLWIGYRDAEGYGHLSAWPTVIAAHRFSFELAHGPIPDGMAVRHRCDNPPCVNPAHLEQGTAIDNNRDKALRGRDATGERHGMARYSEDAAREVKARLARGESQTAIAQALGMNRATVHKIAVGKHWKEVKL